MSDRGNEELRFYAENLGHILRMHGGLFAQTQEIEELRKRGGIPENMLANVAFHRVTERFLEEFRERLDCGDEFAVIDAMSHCVTQYVEVPDWLRDEFLTRYERLLADGSLTLDAAFGPRFPRNAKRTALSDRRNYALVIYHEVEKRKMAGAPVDEALFEGIAKQFGLSMSTTRRHYYWFKDADDLLSVAVRNNMRAFISSVQATAAARNSE